MWCPSDDTSLRSSVRRTSASRIWLRRLLDSRTDKVGMPLNSDTVTTLLKLTRAVGREKRAKVKPVMNAVSSSDTRVCRVTRTLA